MRTEDSTKVAMGCMVVLPLPVFIVWHSFVLTKLWAWFVVSHFGAKSLSMPVAYGLCLIAHMLVSRSTIKGDDSAGKSTVTAVVHAVAAPALALALGWIAQGFL